MLENIDVIYHNCIRFKNEKIFYIDPFGLKENYNDADIIFITHSHYDHFSPEDIEKVRKSETIIVVTQDLYEKTCKLNFDENKIIIVKPNEKYEVEGINFSTVPAYNTNKDFHPKDNNWVGYIIEINKTRYYIAGDTDITQENRKIDCDVAFLPIGGTYTMNSEEAAELANCITPKIVVPVHYNSIVGSKDDEKNFEKLVSSDIKCKIML